MTPLQTEQKGNLDGNLAFAFEKFEGKLNEMPQNEKIAFLLGAFMALDAYFKLGHPESVGLFGREEFMCALRTHIYCHPANFDSPTMPYLKKCAESENEKVLSSFALAMELQNLLGLPISYHQQRTLINLQLVAQMAG
jgi:hypothetical protein